MPVPGVGEITTFSAGGTDYSGLHSALLAVKVWSSGAAAYVWSGDGLAPDPLSYTQILFVDPTGTHNPTTAAGGRNFANDLWQTGGLAFGVAAGGSTGQVLTKNSATSYDTGWTTPSGGGGSGSGIIAMARYDPGTYTSTLTTSTTFADVDAAHLAVTFTAPSTGNVLVELCAGAFTALDVHHAWNVREGSSDLAGTAVVTSYCSSPGGPTAFTANITTKHYVTGLTASSSHTYKWGQARLVGSGNAGTVYGHAAAEGFPAVMTVFAMP